MQSMLIALTQLTLRQTYLCKPLLSFIAFYKTMPLRVIICFCQFVGCREVCFTILPLLLHNIRE